MLWCLSEDKQSGSEQQSFSLTHTTWAACARDLLELVTRHGSHFVAAETAKASAAAEAAVAAGPSAPT